ncbi:MAG: hypothetical protein Q7O66_07285 [Dehalococcoidia bacterium]|nr:hypothetical protein [Dehalococcoidia bacterium]
MNDPYEVNRDINWGAVAWLLVAILVFGVLLVLWDTGFRFPPEPA